MKRAAAIFKAFIPFAATVLWVLLVSTVSAKEVVVNGGKLEIEFVGEPSPALEKAATTWIQNSARAVANYYEKLPVPRGLLRLTLIEGRKVEGGQAFGTAGPLITLSLGRDATKATFAEDWMLPHEILHFGFPSLAKRHHWLEEGLATYLEPIARARAGLITSNEAWSDLVNGLPQGLPEAGDKGLDRTATWGRTYWGGALFCLQADLEIRRRTENRKGLEHALRAIVAAGGTIEHEWKIERVISVGDGATGVPVLRELYDRHKATPVKVDLSALWKELGIIRRGRSVTFDDQAPLAQVRKAITGG